MTFPCRLPYGRRELLWHTKIGDAEVCAYSEGGLNDPRRTRMNFENNQAVRGTAADKPKPAESSKNTLHIWPTPISLGY
jgi:hypothetical protein